MADRGPGEWILVEYSEPEEDPTGMLEPWFDDPEEEASEQALDELLVAVAATGITDDPQRAIKEYRQRNARGVLANPVAAIHSVSVAMGVVAGQLVPLVEQFVHRPNRRQ